FCRRDAYAINFEMVKNKHSAGQQNLNTIMYEGTLKYLSKTLCAHVNPDTVKEFLTAMLPHKAEKLQLFNHRPRTAVEIQLMVEESEERLTEEQIDELIQKVTDVLPGDPQKAGDGSADPEMETDQ
uniref:DNA-directed RNA polymerase III subunit RPC9 n=2 Tax=Sinocyclocheilus grahami TaxID=75366 RepID=A0A672L8Z4_SINGR